METAQLFNGDVGKSVESLHDRNANQMTRDGARAEGCFYLGEGCVRERLSYMGQRSMPRRMSMSLSSFSAQPMGSTRATRDPRHS